MDSIEDNRDKTFSLNLEEIQPSQLFISTEKLSTLMGGMGSQGIGPIDPVPVKELDGKIIYTDGHTRAFAAFLCGQTEINAYWESRNLDWEVYRSRVNWCQKEGIRSIGHLSRRVLSPEDFELLWVERNNKLHEAQKTRREPPGSDS